MKRWVLTIATLLISSVAHTNSPERIEALSGKVIFNNNSGYYVLRDGSCWKMIPFQVRWRTLSEWWDGVELVADNFKCEPKDWNLNSEIQVFAKGANFHIDTTNASNQDDLIQSTHVLYNNNSNQVMFAVAMNPADCMVDVYKMASKESYDKGYNAGYVAKSKNNQTIFENGYKEGYDTGRRDGYSQAYQEIFPQDPQ